MNAMRKLIVIALVVFTSGANAQTWNEWFRQTATQKKYLEQQITALKVYYDYAKKGYQIAQQGLHILYQIKTGDFNLHTEFFESLRNVNPAIKATTKISAIICLQLCISKQVKVSLHAIKESDQFSSEEIDHCQTVFNNLLEQCSHSIDWLRSVLASGELSMSDDERINSIDKIYNGMREHYSFCLSFSKDIELLQLQRSAAINEIERSKKIDYIP